MYEVRVFVYNTTTERNKLYYSSITTGNSIMVCVTDCTFSYLPYANSHSFIILLEVNFLPNHWSAKTPCHKLV